MASLLADEILDPAEREDATESVVALQSTTNPLLCHFRYRFRDDPLINVGRQDIGAWVDFNAVASEARLRVAGFTT